MDREGSRIGVANELPITGARVRGVLVNACCKRRCAIRLRDPRWCWRGPVYVIPVPNNGAPPYVAPTYGYEYGPPAVVAPPPAGPCSAIPPEWHWLMALIMPLVMIVLVVVPVANILHRAGRSRWRTGIHSVAKFGRSVGVCIYSMAEGSQLEPLLDRGLLC
jgi:hypothetical protein